jgi:hypothetical protein
VWDGRRIIVTHPSLRVVSMLPRGARRAGAILNDLVLSHELGR